MSRRRSKRRQRREPLMKATEALAQAETMSHGEQAQMHIAAELMGVDYGDFIEALVKENGTP